MTRWLVPLLLALSWGISGVQADSSPKLTIAAAADLKFAMEEVIAAFKQHHPGTVLELVTGSSGKFYEQIMQEAPFDLFFSADIKYPQQLQAQGLTASDVRSYARGRLVLWSALHDAAHMTLEDLEDAKIGKIALANPKHAPYGMRAREALEQAGMWAKVEHKLVFAENVAQAAQFAETGAADVGLIALSLAMSPALAGKGRYVLLAQTLHAPLEQGYVLLKRARDRPLAHAFAAFVASESARMIFRRYGFLLPGEPLPEVGHGS